MPASPVLALGLLTGRLAAAFGACGVLLAAVAPPASAQTPPVQPFQFQPVQINTQLPDLSVSLAATPQQVGGGKELTYASAVRNTGVVAFYDRTTFAPVY